MFVNRSILKLIFLLQVCLTSTNALTNELRDLGKNVSNVLNSLLSPANYNKNIRPNLGGNPVTVLVNMYIKSIGPISENEAEYTLDLYFRQSWSDARLKFKLDFVKEMSMSWVFVDKVWKPDTFFMNSKKASLHRVTSPNKFLRLGDNGDMTLSMRLTVTASCKMHLKKFPLDSQNCSLLIGSYAYTSSDVIYKWAPAALGTEPGLELAQFDLISSTVRKRYIAKRNADEYYMIQVNFIFKRNIGFFMLQVYVPCSLIICCSWVSFWINPDDVPARIQLGVIPVLSITTIGFGNRSALPKVSHATALDWFLILCFAFAFAVILEYAYINFINKIYSDGRKLYEAKQFVSKVVGTITLCSQSATEDEVEEAYGCVEKGEENVTADKEEKSIGKEIRKESQSFGTSLGPSENGFEETVITDVNKKTTVHPSENEVKVLFGTEAPKIVIESAAEATSGKNEETFQYKRGNDGLSSAELGQNDQPVAAVKMIRLTSGLKSFLMGLRQRFQDVNIFPNEEDIRKKIEEENPEKFPAIDIKSRFIFPAMFTISISIYFISYFYLIPDSGID